MRWYYAENGQQRGPVEDAEFQQLVAVGAIQPETPVWQEGMANWLAYRDLAPGVAGVDVSAAPGGFSTFCSQCGSAFSPEDMLRYEGSYICAKCKPFFFQKLREGVHLSTTLRYAGFRIRFGAKLIDGIILWLIQIALAVVVGMLFSRNSPQIAPIIRLLLGLVQILVGASYSCWFLVKFGATPGKMACRLKVVRPEGGTLSFGRALGRHFAEILSTIILFIGYIMVGFDPEKRALHDRICDTRVIRA